MRGPKIDLKQSILRHMAGASATSVWTPTDFLDLGARREAVDQALHRLVADGLVRRIERGLYDIPHIDIITGAQVDVDYVAIVNAIGRRDGSTPIIEEVVTGEDANVPNARRVIVSTKARLQPLKFENLTIEFKRPQAPKKRATASVPKKAPVRLTGGEGHRYEDFVAARFLLDMLAGTNSLGPEFGRVVRIHWQARDKGWLTDDLAFDCQTETAEKRDVGISVKSNPQVSSAGFPSDFVGLAWSQWLGRGTSRAFRRGVDAIVLATAEIPPTVKKAWDAILGEALETAIEPQRMIDRLTPDPGEGTQSGRLQHALFESLRPPEEYAADVTPPDIIRLLHDIRLLDFDFGNPTSHDAGVALRDCQNILSSGLAIDAQTLWDRLIGISGEKRGKGGSIELRGLLAKLRDSFVFRDHPDFRVDWETLGRISTEAMRAVQTAIAGIAHLPRGEDLTTIRKHLASIGTCFLIGESGCGKSALAKDIAVTDYPRVVWLTASALDHETSAEFDRVIGLRHPLIEILRASPERCLVVFDSLEAYSDRALRLVVLFIQDLISAHATHIQALLLVQFTAAERKMGQLAMLGIPREALQYVALKRPTDNNLKELLTKFPQLRWVAFRPELHPLLANLKVMDWLARSAAQDTVTTDEPYIGLTGVIDRLWHQWTEASNNGFARSHLLMDLGVTEAEALSRGVPRTQIGFAQQNALPSLVQSGLVRVSDDDRVSFDHDLLGDWARMRVLVAEDPTTSTASRARVLSPRWQQAIRLFGQRLLERSPEDQERWRRSVETASEDASPDALMRDLFLDSLFLAVNAYELLDRAWPILSANGGRLLNRLLHRFRIVATLPNQFAAAYSDDKENAARFEHLFRIPFVPYWGPLLTLLHSRREEVARIAPNEAARICVLWLSTTQTELGQGLSFPWRAQAAELALEIAREVRARNIENNHYSSESDRVVYESLLYAAAELPDAVGELCLELSTRRSLPASVLARRDLARQKRLEERNRLVAEGKVRTPPIGFSRGRLRASSPHGPLGPVEREFREACLTSAPFAALVQTSPDVALEVLLAVCIEEPQFDDHAVGSSLPEFGLSYWPEGDPAAYFRGPFLQFLRHAPSQGLSFVLTLTNLGTSRYTGNRQGIDVTVAGQTKKWYGDWNSFRWHHDWPLSHASQIQSSLMALEQWLYEQIDKGASIDPWLSRILAESESLAFAGLLMDIGKRVPGLFSTVLSPLFSSWEIWELDFQRSILRNTGMQPTGYWGNQPQQLVTLAQQWHRLPHRSQYLLGPDGPVARNMLSREDFHPFFAEVRNTWKKHLGNEEESDHLRLLIERINPDNYTFTKSGTDLAVNFQWPEDIERKNNQDLRRINQQQTLSLMPWKWREALNKDMAVPVERAKEVLDYLQALEANPPEIPVESGEPLLRIEDVYIGGIAVLLATNRAWLVEDPDRLAWCRKRLQLSVDSPPLRRRFDSELAVGNQRWDTFAAECGVWLLAEDSDDTLGRQLVAAGLTAFNYHTTGVTMELACKLRGKLGNIFAQMISFSIQWAGLRPLQVRPTDTSLRPEHEYFVERKRSLIQSFVEGKIAATPPNLLKLNSETRAALDAIHEKQFPGSAARSRRREHAGGRTRSRETLYPDRLGLDSYVMKASLGWLNLRDANGDTERRAWLNLVRECLGLMLRNMPVVDAATTQEIDGLPSDFDDWALQLVARTIPQLSVSEKPDELWQRILERGAPAHQWVERFFWHWFTNGLAASTSVAEFVRLWHAMISYALESPLWHPKTSVGHELAGIAAELLCFDTRWNALARDDTHVAAIGAMEEIFSRAFRQWGSNPKVTNGFAVFAVQPGAMRLLLPILSWISAAAKSFDRYDWKYGLEENVTELLRVCWQQEAQRISSDPNLKESFFSLLAILASRGGHPALVLRDRVAGSVAV